MFTLEVLKEWRRAIVAVLHELSQQVPDRPANVAHCVSTPRAMAALGYTLTSILSASSKDEDDYYRRRENFIKTLRAVPYNPGYGTLLRTDETLQ